MDVRLARTEAARSLAHFVAPFAVRQSIRSMLNVSRLSTIAKQYFPLVRVRIIVFVLQERHFHTLV